MINHTLRIVVVYKNSQQQYGSSSNDLYLVLATYGDKMKQKVISIWPEINWIKDNELKEKTLNCWIYAIENSVLSPEDLEVIPFSLLIKDCKITFMNHNGLRFSFCRYSNE
jgi:hypothetical protein